MAKNESFWKNLLTTSADKTHEVENDSDALEAGLEQLSWFENSKRIVKQKIKKTQETFGEEIGNSITHGVPALFFLGMLPYAAIRAYIHAPEGKAVIDAFGVSVFMISVFLMFLMSTWYHTSMHGTPQKHVMNKLDHIMIFFAIAGTYTPITLSLIGGGWGLGLCIAQWVLVIAGTIIKSLMFSKNKLNMILTVTIYLLMGWMVVLCMKQFIAAATAPCFWLILSGGICYTIGVILFASKFKFAHMVWHILVDLGAICHFIAIVYFLR